MARAGKAKQLPAATLPPAQPTYILRGHAAAIHSLCFLRSNTRLLSGDADGFVVLWDLTIKRPKVVWQAHGGTVMGLGTWGDDRIVTHGRDSHLRVWSLSPNDEKNGDFSVTLPVDSTAESRKQPWMLHALRISTLNFCPFSSCIVRKSTSQDDIPNDGEGSLFIAVPGVEDTQVEIFALPSERLVKIVPAPTQARTKTGMVMALRVFQAPGSNIFHLIAGYENGRSVVFSRRPDQSSWGESHGADAHAQPILGLDVVPEKEVYFTSAADAIVVKHAAIVASSGASGPTHESGALKVVQTGHSGQQGLVVRSDARIFATAGWDGRARVYSCSSMKELAVLKWHKEGLYAVAFATVLRDEQNENRDDAGAPEHSKEITRPTTGRVAAAREQKTRSTHWLAAGAKDGKISLWDIY